MILLRKVFSAIIAALAVLLALAAIAWSLSSGSVDETIQHSHEIEKSFAFASSFVESFRQAHGQLPSEAEFTTWANTQPDRAFSARGMHLLTAKSQFPDKLIKRFGPPPRGGYVIEMWRGEWFEYYVSWANASTLEFDARKYYFTGSAITDGLVILCFSILLGFASRWLWPRTTRSSEAAVQKRAAP